MIIAPARSERRSSMYIKLHELKRCPFCGELEKVIQLPFCPEVIIDDRYHG